MGCVNHAERDARFACALCARAFCVECVTWSGGQLICHDCQRPAGAQPAGAPPLVGARLPWEERESLFDIDAIFATIQGVLLRPTATFAAMRTDGGISAPLGYALLLGTIGTLFSLLWQPLQLRLLPGIGMLGAGASHVAPAVLVATALVSPLLVAAGLFLSSGLTHLSLMLLGWAKVPFEGTFRVYCYVYGSLALLQAIPFCGGLIALLWSAILYVLGVAAVQRISFGRAALAAAAPFLACCGCATALLAAIIGGMQGTLAPLALSFSCPFRALTGLPCPTCGGTRALIALAGLRWKEAFYLNPLVFLTAVLGLPGASALAALRLGAGKSVAATAEGLVTSRGGRFLFAAIAAVSWLHLIATSR